MSSGSCQMGLRVTTVGQPLSLAQSIWHPRADDSWTIEKTGMTESKPSSVLPIAASLAISSGTRLAAGKGASANSINLRVAIEVGLHTGALSTGWRCNAASTL